MRNHKFGLNGFQKFLYRIGNWINEGSDWIVELMKSQYINISTYRPLSGSSFGKITCRIKKSKKRPNQHEKQRSKIFLMVSS